MYAVMHSTVGRTTASHMIRLVGSREESESTTAHEARLTRL